MHWDELSELSIAASHVASASFETLKEIYYKTLSKNGTFNFMDNFIVNDRILGCLDKSHRKKPPLKHNLEDTHILLVLCDAATQNNYHFPYKVEQVVQFVNVSTKELLGSNITFQVLSLLPLNFIQSNNDPLCMKGIYFGFPTHIPFSLAPLHPPAAISPPPLLPPPTPVPMNFQFYHQTHAPNEFIPIFGNQNLCMNY